MNLESKQEELHCIKLSPWSEDEPRPFFFILDMDKHVYGSVMFMLYVHYVQIIYSAKLACISTSIISELGKRHKQHPKMTFYVV
jgi:hypothetical protein